ncbi:MAG: hypothetical protein ACYTGY_13510 [Planctomycetota bacterium]
MAGAGFLALALVVVGQGDGDASALHYFLNIELWHGSESFGLRVDRDPGAPGSTAEAAVLAGVKRRR